MTPAFRLLAACCRWPNDDARATAIWAAASGFDDWDELARLTDRHRVEPLVVHGLAAAGLAVPPALAAAADRHRSAGVRDLAETLRIAAALDAAGIKHRFLKGAPLGVAAYGTPFLKRSWDVDLLVLPADAVAAAALLAERGYAPDMPPRPLDREEYARWSKVSKEAELRSPRGTVIELHWRVSDHPALLPSIDAATPARCIPLLGDHRVATLADDANLAYLAVHGTAHAWSRIKWIADFNALLQSIDPGDRPTMLHRARQFGTGHAIEAALSLLGCLFRSSDDSAYPAPASPLTRFALDALASDDQSEIERSGKRARWRLGSGPLFIVREATIRLRGTRDRELHPLSSGWQWLYPVLRITFWIARRFQGNGETDGTGKR